MQKTASIYLPILSLGMLLFCGACSTIKDYKQKQLLNKMSMYIEGDFSNEQQYEEWPQHYYNLSVHIAPIWAGTAKEKWFYVEQSHLLEGIESVYRQRIYRLSMDTINNKKIHCDIYRMDSITASKVKYRNPASLKTITKEKIAEVEGCGLKFVWYSDRKYFYASSGSDCSHTYKGAAYMSSVVYLYENEMQSNVKGVNYRSQTMWGSKRSDYIFVKK